MTTECLRWFAAPNAHMPFAMESSSTRDDPIRRRTARDLLLTACGIAAGRSVIRRRIRPRSLKGAVSKLPRWTCRFWAIGILIPLTFGPFFYCNKQ